MNRVLVALLFAAGCAQPTHLQYDFSRSFDAAFKAQADLTRPSAANAAYELSGTEGLALRQTVVKATTDEESGKAEMVEDK